MPQHFDTVIIGAGPGGRAAATELVEAGKSVALIESDGFGGVCPLRGCNPKKVLMGPSEAVAFGEDLVETGLSGTPAVDWPALARFNNSFLDGLAERIEDHYFGLGIETIRGEASLVAPNKVRVGEEEYVGEHVIIATGLVPRPLDFSGSELLSTSDDFLALQEMPASIVFIGGGFVSMELAHLAARAGADVTILLRGDRALRMFDKDIVDTLLKATEHAGIDVVFNAPVERAAKGSDGTVTVETSKGNYRAAMVVNAAGRVPAVKGLNLDAVGIEHGRKGIVVDEQMRCNGASWAFAVGDVAATPYNLTPTGDMEGRVAARTILGRDARADYANVARVVFTLPPVCAVGMTEEEAEKAGLDIEVKQTNLADSFSWKRLGKKHAACKMLIDKKRDVLVGAHMVGNDAGELANLFLLAIETQVDLSVIRKGLFGYPTSGYYFRYMV